MTSSLMSCSTAPPSRNGGPLPDESRAAGSGAPGRGHPWEASEALRGLIDSIVLIPQDGQLRIGLRGNLAAMLTAARVAFQPAAGLATERQLPDAGGRSSIVTRPTSPSTVTT